MKALTSEFSQTINIRNLGIEVAEDLSDCDVLFGVKEVPVYSLIADKSYFFFSHTIKKQPYNRALLQTILERNITIYDHETIVDANGRRLIGFGRYAGIVGNNAPDILTKDMLQSKDCKIKVVGDVSCDIDGPIACTLRSSTIAEPFYGYLPSEHKEVDVFHPAAIVVMAVDNLPCELPKDASEGFGTMFMEHVIPAFFNDDKDGILARAKITEKGKLTARFSYLQDFVDGK